jgi:DNA polymerase I
MSKSTANQPSERKIFLLIDGHAVIYRAFYAFPGLTDTQGRMINAVYGFARIILTAIRDFRPEYIAVTFDCHAPTFRHDTFTEYKANRAEMPDDLKPQIELIKQVVTALNIPQFAIPGYEADDIIGTISKILEQPGQPGRQGKLLTIIVTGDRDTLQLVDDDTHVWMPGRGKNQSDREYDTEAATEKMGVPPNQLVDLKALMGDSSDNIPGVKGVGPKTAIALIKQFGSLDGLYQALENGSAQQDLKPAVVTKLMAEKPQAYLSQGLARIDCSVPLTFTLQDCAVNGYDKGAVVELFAQFDFHSLIPLLPSDAFEASVQEALF